MFNGQGNDLAAYLAEPPFTKQLVDHHRDDAHPTGLDLNGQICFDPKRPKRFVAGEDTLQDTTGHPGWGILELSGTTLGKLSIHEVGKLVPTYQPSNDNPENYGCGFLPDGRILTTDVGNQATGTGDGQLIVWFPPFESRTVKYCKVDVTLTTGQGVLVERRLRVRRAGAAAGSRGVPLRRERPPDLERGERRLRRKGRNRCADGDQRLVDAVHRARPGQHARDAQRDREGAEREALRVERLQRRDRRVHRRRQVRA